jgi:hypothetical protein
MAVKNPGGAKSIWRGMLQRCLQPRNPSYRYYGARGITVCERWRSFENFLADMGERPPGLSIQRINNLGNYEPGNCRWATARDQVLNRGRSEEMLVRVTPELRAEIEKAAAEQRQSLASVMRDALLSWAEKRISISNHVNGGNIELLVLAQDGSWISLPTVLKFVTKNAAANCLPGGLYRFVSTGSPNEIGSHLQRTAA